MHHERDHFPAQYSNGVDIRILDRKNIMYIFVRDKNRDFEFECCALREFFFIRVNEQFSFLLSFYFILFFFFSPPSFRCHFVPCDIMILVSCAALAESRCWYLQTKLCTSFLNKYEVYMTFVSSFHYHYLAKDICYFCYFTIRKIK